MFFHGLHPISSSLAKTVSELAVFSRNDPDEDEAKTFHDQVYEFLNYVLPNLGMRLAPIERRKDSD